MKSGKVHLVGAGPGDPGLITQKGLQCIAEADVIVYDHLADERLLAVLPEKSEKIYVGKSASEHTMEQVDINQLLVTKSKEGKNVVRLKGGDPFVFGRGGEEADVLAENRIDFEIVPGISSSVAVPAYAGIPVTHRGIASSFAVITGHEDPTKNKSDINWQKLATAVDTLVFLMGMSNLEQIAAQLIKFGRSPKTPVAVIKDGTLSTQQTVTGDLASIARRVKEKNLQPPAVIVVGEVVRLREKLRWFDNLPLFGKRILVTRARHQASALSRMLSERGAQPVELPAIEIQHVDDTGEMDDAILNLQKYDWIVFTSVNGVERFFQRIDDVKLDSRAFGSLKIGAIGAATAKSLKQYGLIPDYCPDVFTGAALLEGFKKLDIIGKKFLLLRADIADEALAKGLLKSGAEVKEVTVYKTVKPTGGRIQARRIFADKIDFITFTSSSTVSNLVASMGEKPFSINGAKIACIGPKTAETAIKAGFTVELMASEHTIPGLVAALENYYRRGG